LDDELFFGNRLDIGTRFSQSDTSTPHRLIGPDGLYLTAEHHQREDAEEDALEDEEEQEDDGGGRRVGAAGAPLGVEAGDELVDGQDQRVQGHGRDVELGTMDDFRRRLGTAEGVQGQLCCLRY